jgi:ubiquinone/menaquinone biosynthesis C-methylase UbiE
MGWLQISRYRRHCKIFAGVWLTLLLAGCTSLKQCSYEGLRRDQWQQPDTVMQSLQLSQGAVVADLGSGSGYFTLRLARAVGPTGKVYAADIDSSINDALRERAHKHQLNNIEVILSAPDDPRLPGPVDLLFTSNTYHHIDDRVAYFSALRKYLRPRGRLAVIDYDRRTWLARLWGHYTPKDLIKREVEQAGYELQHDFDFLDRQSFLIFTPNAGARSSLTDLPK